MSSQQVTPMVYLIITLSYGHLAHLQQRTTNVGELFGIYFEFIPEHWRDRFWFDFTLVMEL